MQSSYDAFISYRRREAGVLARWIRNRLQRYRLPPEVLRALSKEKQEIHQRRPRIYLDRIYEKPAGDFLHDKIFPALDASQRLIVLSTPSAFDTIVDAHGGETANWLVQEIDRFLGLETETRHRAVDVVLGPRAPENRFPGRLSEKARWDWIDLRAFNWWRSWGLSEELDDGFTKLAAGIYDVPLAALPMMRQEERRRRRHFVMAAAASLLFFLAIVSALGVGWWNARKATQIADAERRFNVALRLADSGAIPSAVDAFARLADDGLQRSDEAKRLLISWAPRLATASRQVMKLPDQSAFRWRGRNYVKAGGKVTGGFDGPPALQGTVTSKGTLVTFDSDRSVRVRKLSELDKPVLEIGPLDATPGSISELFDGRLFIFESQMLGLHSDEDEDDAQVVYGRLFAIFSPDDARYAIVVHNPDDGKGPDIDCSSIKWVDANVQLSGSGQSTADTAARGALTIRAMPGGGLDWQFEKADDSQPPAAVQPRQTPPAACQRRVLVPSPVDPMIVKNAELNFPALIDEKRLWKDFGTAQKSPEPSLCEIDGDGKERIHDNCYSYNVAVSIDPGRADNLVRLLGDPLIPEAISLGGSIERLVVATVTGNQSVSTAYCEVGEQRRLKRCVMLDHTARTSKTFLAGNEFAALHSEEAFEHSFQLVDLRNLRTISLNPSPGEKLADVTMSPDGKRLVTLTRLGEVWAYDIDRDNASGRIARRYDFRRGTEPEFSATSAKDQKDSRPSVAFSKASFVDNGRLMLNGAKGGTVLAEIPSGEVIWARPATLPGTEQQIASNSASNVAVVYDKSSAQLVSLDSGALLSRVVDLDSIDLDTKEIDETAATTVVVLPDSSIRISYKGHIVGPSGVQSDAPAGRENVKQITGLGSRGEAGPLDIFLAPAH